MVIMSVGNSSVFPYRRNAKSCNTGGFEDLGVRSAEDNIVSRS